LTVFAQSKDIFTGNPTQSKGIFVLNSTQSMGKRIPLQAFKNRFGLEILNFSVPEKSPSGWSLHL